MYLEPKCNATAFDNVESLKPMENCIMTNEICAKIAERKDLVS